MKVIDPFGSFAPSAHLGPHFSRCICALMHALLGLVLLFVASQAQAESLSATGNGGNIPVSFVKQVSIPGPLVRIYASIYDPSGCGGQAVCTAYVTAYSGPRNWWSANGGTNSWIRDQPTLGITELEVSFAIHSTATASISVMRAEDIGKPVKYCERADGDCIYVPDGPLDDDIDDGADIATYTSGSYLTTARLGTPVVAELGYSDFLRADADPTTSGGAPAPAYFFSSSAVPFTQFTIPAALPSGDSDFTVVFGAFQSQPLQAGVPFDFTAYVPGGVTAFLLRGFSGAEAPVDGQSFPYEHGFKFAQQGPTVIRHGTVRPGDYTMGGLINADDFNVWRAGFGSTSDLPADGNQDGTVDAADYVFWRKWQAISQATPGIGSGAAVPEPATMCLAGMPALATLIVRLRRHKMRR